MPTKPGRAIVLFGGRVVSGASTALEIHTADQGGYVVQRSILTRDAAILDAYLREQMGEYRPLIVRVGPSGAILAGDLVELQDYDLYSLAGGVGAFQVRYVADPYSPGLKWLHGLNQAY